MNIPFWLRLSLVIFIGILIAVWFSGESTRKLDTEFLLDRIRDDMQRTTGLVAESVVVGDDVKTEEILKEYALSWSEFTYIYVLDDDGFYVAEW